MRLQRHAGAAHRVAALAADGHDGEVAVVLGDLAGREPDRVGVERPASPRSVVMRTIRRLPPSRREKRVVLAVEDGRQVREDLVELLRVRPRASVASWARLSLDAATNCNARVICLMLRTAGSAAGSRAG